MWGAWGFILAGALGGVLLIIALAVGWAVPLIGVALVLLVAPLVLFLMTRESGEPGGEGTEEAGTGLGGKPSWLRKRWYQ